MSLSLGFNAPPDPDRIAAALERIATALESLLRQYAIPVTPPAEPDKRGRPIVPDSPSQRILGLVRDRGPLHRAAIIEALGLPAQRVHNAMTALRRTGRLMRLPDGRWGAPLTRGRLEVL